MKTIEEIRSKITEIESKINIRAKKFNGEEIYLYSVRHVLNAVLMQPKEFSNQENIIEKIQTIVDETKKLSIFLNLIGSSDKELPESVELKTKGLQHTFLGALWALIWVMGDEDRIEGTLRPTDETLVKDVENILTHYNVHFYDSEGENEADDGKDDYEETVNQIFDDFVGRMGYSISYNFKNFSPE